MCLESIYQQVLQELKEIDVTEIDDLLDLWQTLRPEVTRNIRSERFLNIEVMRRMLCCLQVNRGELASSNEEAFFRKYKEFCWNSKNTLQGGCARDIESTKLLGHAIDRGRLQKRMIWIQSEESEEQSVIPVSISSIIDRLIIDCEGEKNVYSEYWIQMSERIMWATWENDNQEQNAPFNFIQIDSPYEVGLYLALDPRSLEPFGVSDSNNNTRNLLLLVYEAQDHSLYRPTIADAGDNKYFIPSTVGDNYGMTSVGNQELESYYFPRLEQAGYINFDNYANSQGRPEVVHKPIQVQSLFSISSLSYPQ